MTDMFRLQEDAMRAQDELQRRFAKIGRGGLNLTTLSYVPALRSIQIGGGPRNREAHIPEPTKRGLQAAFMAVQRAGRRFEAAMVEARS
jgi:hypothetical protein